MRFSLPILALLILVPAHAAWPPQVSNIQIQFDPAWTAQPAKWYTPGATEPRPLLVGLHTWSGNYAQSTGEPYAAWAVAHGWVFIHPNFQGPNNRPEAMGSDLACKDIIAAVDYALTHANVDPARIYLVGVSGGGHMTLLMSGKAAPLWTAASAWVPIVDVADWYDDSRRLGNSYHRNVESCLGGAPVPGSTYEAEAMHRSPRYFLHNAADLPLDINAGVHDGHRSYSVPIYHTLEAYNVLAATALLVPQPDIDYMVAEEAAPATYPAPPVDPRYGAKVVLFRRESGPTRATIFEGVHEIIYDAALNWLAQHVAPRPPLPGPWVPFEGEQPPLPAPEVVVTSSPGAAIPDDHDTGITSQVFIPENLPIQAAYVYCSIPHSWVGDLVVTLTHEATGTRVVLLERPGRDAVGLFGGYGDAVSAWFSDAGAWAPYRPLGGPVDGVVLPAEPLSAFAGETAAGTWTLAVQDGAWGNTGTLASWTLGLDLVEPTSTPTDTPTPTPTHTPTETPTPVPTDTPTLTPTLPSTPIPNGRFDLNDDGMVDGADPFMLMEARLDRIEFSPADFDASGLVDSRDLLRFADRWRVEVAPG